MGGPSVFQQKAPPQYFDVKSLDFHNHFLRQRRNFTVIVSHAERVAI
jgi:hypothetical protein